MGYLSTHVLYPFFKEQVEESLRKSQFFSVGYDESLNKVAQKTQMDINIRHLHSSTGLVNTKYLTSEFLGSCKAVDLLIDFLTDFLKSRNLICCSGIF